MKKQKIFTNSFVDKLYTNIGSGESIMDYFDETMEILPENTFDSKVTVPEVIPELKTDADTESAIALYEYLGDLDRTQASDPRFWTYLAHVTFRNYAMNRYEINEDMLRKDVINSIIDHWFVNQNDRSLRRHSISRLWWAVKLTISPWEKDTENFGHLENADPYLYTRLLFSNQDIYQQILERSLGKSQKILIAFLEFLNQNPEFTNRSNYRDLVKELNLILGFKKITIHSYNELYEEIKYAAQSILN